MFGWIQCKHWKIFRIICVLSKLSCESGVIINLVIITTEDYFLSVQNPSGNVTALTITPLAGGTGPISAHLTILQIA